MRELHKLTHQPVNLSMRQGDEIVYIERTYSERSGMQVVRAVGGRAPLHLTSVGKLFLARTTPSACAPTRRAPGWPATRATASPTVARSSASWRAVSQYGTARDDEELELGVRCMAAGILDDQGKLVAGLSISAPADRLEEAWLERLRATAATDLGEPRPPTLSDGRSRAGRRAALSAPTRRNDRRLGTTRPGRRPAPTP